MRKILYALVVATLLMGCGKGEVASPKVDHVVIIGLDAMSSHGMQRAATPNLNRMIENGASSINGRCILTPASTQNWATMLTGAIPVQHGVTGNPWQRDNHRIDPYIANEDGLFPSIFDWVREGRKDAKVYMLHEWKNVKRMFSWERVNICEKTPTGEATFERAEELFFADRPDLLYMHILDTDHVGHNDGHDTEEFYSCIEKYDTLIGQFVERVEKEGLLDNTLIMVVADHGGFLGTHSGESEKAIEIPIILYGGGVQKGVTLSKYFIFDVAPTAAWAMGVEWPEYVCVGKPLTEAFDKRNRGNLAYAPVARPSHNGALFHEPIDLTLTADWPTAEVRYTTDGTTPTKESPLYTAPIHIEKDCTVRFATYVGDVRSKDSFEHYRFSVGQERKVRWYLYEDPGSIYVPDFKGMYASDSGYSYDISLDEIQPKNDKFAVRYKATIHIAEDGKYRFHSRSDDGCWLKVDGKVVFASSTSHFQENYGDTKLTAGNHEIEVGYFQKGKRKHLSLLINRVGAEKAAEKFLAPADFCEPWIWSFVR